MKMMIDFIQGKTIELNDNPGLSEGEWVEILVRTIWQRSKLECWTAPVVLEAWQQNGRLTMIEFSRRFRWNGMVLTT